jgi:opacity protein-like surface antigen
MRKTILLTLLLALAAASPARADWLLTPYIGGVFGGASNQFTFNDTDDEFEQRMNFGLSFGYYSKGIFGIEVDYSAAPNFFQYTGGTNNFDLLDLDSSVQTLMGNVVLALPVGGPDGPFRPYVTAGLGTIRTQLRSESDVFDDLTSNDSGYNFGAGAHLLAAGRVGIRADVRYFRGFEAIDDEDPVDNPLFDQPFADEVFNFWRGTIGVTFRFGQ